VYIYVFICFLCDFSCGIFSLLLSKLKKRKKIGSCRYSFLPWWLCLISEKKLGKGVKYGFFFGVF
jgi:hypothetical protein